MTHFILRGGAALAFIAVLNISSAQAQTVSGSVSYNARCGGSASGLPMNFGDNVSLSAHGDCPDGQGGLASSNDVSDKWIILRGLSISDVLSTSDFFGTHADAGTASASHNYTLTANDVYFTNIANPGDNGIITCGGLHYLIGGIITTQGHSNCSANWPNSSASFSLQISGLNGNGSSSNTAGGSSTSGPFNGYANDGTLIPAVTNSAGIGLAFNNTLNLIVAVSSSVLYCDSPPSEFGAARAKMEIRLPCGTPVFDLPPGYTVNSPQLGIVNNIYNGPACCVGDLTGDHVVDLADLAILLSHYGATGATAAMGDLNGDTVVDLADLGILLSHYGATCI